MPAKQEFRKSLFRQEVIEQKNTYLGQVSKTKNTALTIYTLIITSIALSLITFIGIAKYPKTQIVWENFTSTFLKSLANNYQSSYKQKWQNVV